MKFKVFEFILSLLQFILHHMVHCYLTLGVGPTTLRENSNSNNFDIFLHSPKWPFDIETFSISITTRCSEIR